jgi:Mrp family chromosome partitioning ATPase
MESFETLKKYFPEAVPPPAARSYGKPTVIAVGGAKGGIGKSIFSANLGTYGFHLGPDRSGV